MRKRYFCLLILIAIGFFPFSVFSAPNYIKKYIPEPNKIGEGYYKFLIWTVYKAQLYSEDDEISYNKKLALRLSYKVDASAQRIIKETINQFKKQGIDNEEILEKWKVKMEKIFPDVLEGESLTAILMPKKQLLFFKNGKFISQTSDIVFAERFLDIWLSEKTTSPSFRKKLLGLTE